MHDPGRLMRIVIDGTHAINDIRAIQRYAYHLILQLNSLQHDAHMTFLYLAAMRTAKTRPCLRTRDDQREVLSRIPGKLLKLATRTLGFPRIETLVGHGCDLVHFPGGLPQAPTRAARVLTTIHGCAHREIPEWISDGVKHRLESSYKVAVARSTHFITVSETNKGELSRHYGIPPERIAAIPLGISPEFRNMRLGDEDRRRLLARFDLPERDVMLFVGALEPHKNIASILRAFSLVARQAGDRWLLVLVGKKSRHQAAFEDEIRKGGVRGSVRFIDYLRPGSDDLAALYNLARIFVFPTFYEGWASPPLEAMVSGTPVIASDIPALRESTGGHALYPDPHSARDIAECMQRLDGDSDLYERLRAAGERFASLHTWRLCAERTLNHYSALLGVGKGVRPLFCEAPYGPFREKRPDPFSHPCWTMPGWMPS